MAKFLDVFLSSIAIFFVTFCWAYYVLHDGKTAFWASLIVGVCASYIVYRIVSRSQNKANASKRQKAKLTSFANYLCFCPNAQEVFADLLKYYTFDIISIAKEHIIATKNNQRYFVALLFDNDCVTIADLRKTVRKAKDSKANKLIVFCIGVKSTEIRLANSEIPTTFVDSQSGYALFEQADKLPPLDKPVVKKSAYVAQFAFSKKRFGGYFASGMFLLVTSAMTFFPLYSILWGTALLALALYSLLNRKYNVKPSVVSLE